MLELPDDEESYWQEAYPKSTYPELTDDLAVDVAIVGAGITGLTAAYLLKQSGFTVAVVDKRTIGSGTTGRTTGKVTSQHNLIYNELRQRLGKKTARIYGEANQSALEQVAKIIEKEEISCEWQREDNYVFTDDSTQVEAFKQETKLAAELGLPASFETNLPLPFEVKAAVKFADQGKIHAQKYLLGLAKAVNGNGSFIFENSNVIGIRDGNPGRIRTNEAKIVAKHIIVATNVPTLPLTARGTYCVLEYPTESYIVAGRLDKKIKSIYISPDKHNYSILPVEANKMLLIGGEGHISGLSGNKKARYQRLADYAESRFGITEITHRWSDRDYLSYDRIPLIGKLYPWSMNLYVATAYGKWGLTGGTVAGMILNDLIGGKDNSWTPVFNSNRLEPIKSIPRVVGKYLRKNR